MAALQALHIGSCQVASQPGILAVGFAAPAPPGVSKQVDVGREAVQVPAHMRGLRLSARLEGVSGGDAEGRQAGWPADMMRMPQSHDVLSTWCDKHLPESDIGLRALGKLGRGAEGRAKRQRQSALYQWGVRSHRMRA